MMCVTVSLTVVPSFSDITDVSTIGHSSKTDRSRTPLFHVAQYGDDVIGRELNLRKLPGRKFKLATGSHVELFAPLYLSSIVDNDTPS